MYGFLRPNQCQLSKEDRETYKKFYCGQCAALQKLFGYKWRLLLSWDTALLGLLISAQQKKAAKESKAWCAIFPRKHKACSPDELPQIFSASMAMLIFSMKLADSQQEKKSIFTHFISKLCDSRFTKAKKILESLNFFTSANILDITLKRQQKIETRNKLKIQEYAEPSACFFAHVFRFTAITAGIQENEETLYKIGYHVGKIIYVIDSCIDIVDDIERKKFNALLAAFQDDQTVVSAEAPNEVTKIIITALNTIKALIKDLKLKRHQSIINNILHIGFPQIIGNRINKSIKRLEKNNKILLKYLPHTAVASILCLFIAKNAEAAAPLVWGDSVKLKDGCIYHGYGFYLCGNYCDLCCNPCICLVPSAETYGYDSLCVPLCCQLPKTVPLIIAAAKSAAPCMKAYESVTQTIIDAVTTHSKGIKKAFMAISVIALASIPIFFGYRFIKTKYDNYIARQELIKNSAPSQLMAEINFSDDKSILPNSIIDAGEDSRITITVSNTGEGRGFDTTLFIKSDYGNLTFPEAVSLGDIEPAASKDISVDVKADLNLKSGQAPFTIHCAEKRGYDSKTYTLNLQAAALQKPELIITNFKINDGDTGLARGNGNGVPENGETIELIPLIMNSGIGKAIKVSVAIASINKGIEIKRQSVSIPQITPGQTVTGNLSFFIPPLFSDKEITIDLTALDVRRASETKKVLAIATETRQPVLAYNHKIIDSDQNGFLESGEEGEIEILAANNGGMEARDINVDLSCQDISFSNTHAHIERIASASKFVPLRFAFKIPRTLQKNSINVSIRMNQKDFSDLTDTINIPIKPITPDFKITHQVRDQNNNSIIKKGETIDLIVRVSNIGELDAENVVLTMDISHQGATPVGIVFGSDKTKMIGGIAAADVSEPQQFSIHLQHRARAGNLPVRFSITQKDFPDKNISIALNIAAEQAEDITIAGRENLPKSLHATQAVSNTAPVIAIASPKNNNKTASETGILAGTVVDDKGIAYIEIMVNGKRLDSARSVGGVKGGAMRAQKERDLRVKIPLQPGKNKIIVTAFDIENLSSSKSITVYREAERGEIWAAVIGINKYKNSKIPSLKYARNDAQAFAAYLRDNMDIERDHLFELYDEEATKVNLLSVLGTRLSRKANRSEDTVFIFFAGHGAPEKDPLSKDGDGISKYILAHDSDPQDFYATAMPMDRIAEIFARIRAERIIFIADSCYSGGSGGRTILAKGRRANLSDAFLNRIAQTGKGRIILTSSNTNEVSQESDKLQHGFFTYYLLKGLKGEADLDEDKLIDIDEIYRYLNKWVPDKTNGTQHPVKKGEAEGQVLVGRIK